MDQDQRLIAFRDEVLARFKSSNVESIRVRTALLALHNQVVSDSDEAREAKRNHRRGRFGSDHRFASREYWDEVYEATQPDEVFQDKIAISAAAAARRTRPQTAPAPPPAQWPAPPPPASQEDPVGALY